MAQATFFLLAFAALIEISLSSTAVAGIKGKSIKLKCNLPVANPASLMWVDFVYNSSPEPQIIFDSLNNPAGIIDEFHPNRNQYDVSSDFTLTIRHLSVDKDAGIHECRSFINDTMLKKKYDLTVAAMPQCTGKSMLISGDLTQLVCQSDYSGNNFPRLSWFNDEGPLDSVDDFDIRVARHVLRLETAISDNGKNYRCMMTLDGVEEECHVQLNVQYHAQGMKMTSEKEFFQVGEEIFCSAKGNPIPEVILSSDLGDESQGEGETSMTVREHWRGKQVKVTCLAQNSLNKHPHERFILFQVADEIRTTKDNRPQKENLPHSKEKGVASVDNSADSSSNNSWTIIVSTLFSSVVSMSMALTLLH